MGGTTRRDRTERDASREPRAQEQRGQTGESFVDTRVRDWTTRLLSVERAMRDLAQDQARRAEEWTSMQARIDTLDGTIGNIARIVDEDRERLPRLRTDLDASHASNLGCHERMDHAERDLPP